MGLPPRPDKPTPRELTVIGGSVVGAPPLEREGSSPSSIPITVERDKEPSPQPAELDQTTRDELVQVIARAISSQLGHVRISSIPPEPPRSSIRVAAQGTTKASKWAAIAVGALATLGQLIVWFGKPEYAGPIAQALKLIASLVGGGPPAVEPP